MKNILWICLVILYLSLSLSGLAYTQEADIDFLRDEIKMLQKRIDETEVGRKGVVDQLQDINRQMELRTKLIKELQSKVRESNRSIERIDKSIREIDSNIEVLSVNLVKEEAGLTELKVQTGERLSLLYKNLKGLEVALLFSSTGLNDLFERRQYIKAIGKYDQARIEKLKEKRDEVATVRDEKVSSQNRLKEEKKQRVTEVKRLNSLLQQRKEEEQQLGSQRRQKQQVLKKISSDSDLLNALLEERRRALQQIENEINRLENKSEVFIDLHPDVPFGQLSGKLSWPVKKHRITQKFGRVIHPKLGTSTMNPGVDIEAKRGDPVYAVAYGKVTKISYLRSFGNTLIISHGEGYYTVYARLANIAISEGEIVKAGQVIGEVGDVGIEGDFHFEVWRNRNTLDPTQWLRK